MLDASPGAEATVLDGDRGWRGDPCATAEVHPGSPHRADGAGEKGEKVGDAKEISLASQRLRVPRATVVRLVCYGPESTTFPTPSQMGDTVFISYMGSFDAPAHTAFHRGSSALVCTSKREPDGGCRSGPSKRC